MRWPWQRDPETEPAALEALHEAEENLEAAKEHLADAKAQWPEVREVSRSLRNIRERNHFGESIERIFRGDVA